MNFEGNFESGKRVDQLIAEVEEDLSRQLMNKGHHQEVVAKLLTARIATKPDSRERRKIDDLLYDIGSRYGDL